MLTFFLTKTHPINTATKKYSKFDWIKRRYLFDINKVVEYYQNRPRVVENRNIFSRLIYLLSPNIDLDLIDYFKYVDRSGEYLARTFGLVSNISKGKVFKNLFYLDNEYVVVNYSNNYINLLNVPHTWRLLRPLRMIYSTSTDFDYYQFDKSKSRREITTTCVELDINMMLLQYKYWARERLRLGYSTNPNVYVCEMLYPNFMLTSIDIILFNRFIKLFYNEPIEEFTLKHPFHLLDYTKGIDNIYSTIISDYDRANVPIVQLLRTIPTIVNNDMIDTLYINRPVYNRQSEWALWVARIRYINFIIDILGERGRNRNKQELNTLPALIRMLENRSTDIYSQLPDDLHSEFNMYLEQIKNKIGRR